MNFKSVLIGFMSLVLPLTMVMAQKSDETKKNKTDRQVKELPIVERVVVTASLIPIPEKEAGSSITVVSRKEIEEKQATSVLDVLRTVPAVDVVQNGGSGGAASVFIRGAKSEHTLVMIDGVEMNDPMSPSRSFDFANLGTENIEQIEIIRGPQSTLFGSDAIGGVINIITRRGQGPLTADLSFEGGAYKTFTERAAVRGGTGTISYSLALSRTDSDGFSAAGGEYGNEEKDGYGKTFLSSALQFRPADNASIDLMVNYTAAKADLDNEGGLYGDDPNHKSDTRQLFYRVQGKLSLFNNVWEQKLGISGSDIQRDYDNETDPGHPASFDNSSYSGNQLKIDWQHNLYLAANNTLTMGIDRQEEKGESEYFSQSAWGSFNTVFPSEKETTTGYYMQDQVKLRDSWFTTVGVRYDSHSSFGSHWTYRVASAFLIEKTGSRIRASLGTGFKAPSLYQIHSPYGSSELEPEKSTGFDMGFEQYLFNRRLQIGVTYFSNSYEDMIDFNGATYSYCNIAKASSSGIEAFVALAVTSELDFRLSYNYTDSEDEATGDPLLRRAKHKFSFNWGYNFSDRGFAGMELVYTGKRNDVDFSAWPAAAIELDSFFLVNLSASYKLSDSLRLFVRLRNLLNEKYELIKGYGTPGLSVYGGIGLSL